jgi:hypothetical protein
MAGALRTQRHHGEHFVRLSRLLSLHNFVLPRGFLDIAQAVL